MSHRAGHVTHRSPCCVQTRRGIPRCRSPNALIGQPPGSFSESDALIGVPSVVSSYNLAPVGVEQWWVPSRSTMTAFSAFPASAAGRIFRRQSPRASNLSFNGGCCFTVALIDKGWCAHRC